MKSNIFIKTAAAALCTTLLLTSCGPASSPSSASHEAEKNNSGINFAQIMYTNKDGENFSMYAIDTTAEQENTQPVIQISYQDPEINKEGNISDAKILNDFHDLLEKYEVENHSEGMTGESGAEYFGVSASYNSGKEIDLSISGKISEKDQKMVDDFVMLFKNATVEMPQKVFSSTPNEGADEKASNYINEMLGKANVSSEILSNELVTSDVPLDSNSVLYFTELKDTTGVKKITASTSLLNTFAYHLTIIETEDGQAENVANRIGENIAWDKFVCVSPDKAFIGVDGNYVIYLLAVNDIYDALEPVALKDIPSPVKTLENPFVAGDDTIAEIPSAK